MGDLKGRIQIDLTAALKQRDGIRVSTLRLMLSALNYAFIEKGKDLSADDGAKVLMFEAKKRKESIAAYTATRPELAEQERQELAIIEEYLPAQISDEELQQVIEEVWQTLDPAAKNSGRAMGAVMKQLAGKFVDGSRVKTLVEQRAGRP